MGRKRRGKPINGWIIIDKPAGITSNAVVGRVRRLTGAAKVGHGGTLDPLATGVLPLALGEATKTVSYAMDGTKVYDFTLRWGEARATDDAEGEVTATSEVRPARDAIEAALAGFIGNIEQVPPEYSAVKVDGQRAYDLARKAQPVELKPRTIRIDDFQLVGTPDPDHAIFRVTSGKGAYMRGLARDLALALGTVGHVAALRRLKVGPFEETSAISLDKLETLGHSAPLEDLLLPVETALDDIPALALTGAEARCLRLGQPIPALPVANRTSLQGIGQDDILIAMTEGKPVALARIRGGEIRPVRVLNL
ncbi:MAG: tRNA pseudouridine(55) synthase TruB [Rhodospirillales bacterium]|nr:tRNA pseudouridine(55) synthase TruB [Rhodospirillales bacterium]